jgi:hypothetical protein
MAADGVTFADMRGILRPLWVLLALIFLLEAWLWDHLKPVVAAIVDVVPWGRLKLWLAALLERMPPWAALIVFIIPLIVLFPIKVAEVWFITHGQWLGAVVTLLAAKLVGLGVTAFVFDATRDKLLQMHWFARVYDWFLWTRDWAHALVEPYKHRVLVWMRRLRPAHAGRLLRRILRIRRRMRAVEAR